jgi:hypothetical protein
MKNAGLTVVLVILIASGAWGADFEWPSQMSVGGFQITDIRGTVRPDGSGSATGTLQVQNLGNASVRLARSARGDISGATSIDTRGVRGGFTLSSSGLRGQGTVDCAPKSIVNASISISPRGEVSGSGRLELGRLSPSVDFNMAGSSCSFRGSTPARAQVDTAIASYKFDGTLSVQGGGGRATGTVSGRVERTSKVANQVTSFAIPNTSVDVSRGQCTVNVGGVSVTFSLF